jgi:hypothetical protein
MHPGGTRPLRARNRRLALTKNMGATDRGIRAVVGVVLLVLFFRLESGVRYVGLLGIVMLLTAAVGYCPLYKPFGIRTTPTPRAS